MIVWWAAFLFIGTFFPSCTAGIVPAIITNSILFAINPAKSVLEWARPCLVSSTGLIIIGTATLFPADTGVFSGRSERHHPRNIVTAAPAEKVRKKVVSMVEGGGLSDESSAIIKALLVADRSSLSCGMRELWRRTGTAHYLALSGLHLGLIAVPIYGLLTLCGARGVSRDLIGLLVLSFYAAVAGRPGSLMRALSMIAVMRSFRLAGSKIGLARCVAGGAFLACMIDPTSLRDVGYLLSLNAAAGVALLGVPACARIRKQMMVSSAMKILTWPVLAIVMSLSVQISMLPMIVRLFGSSPAAGPVMSMLMALPVTILLYGGFLYILFEPFLGFVVSAPVNALSWMVIRVVSRGAEISSTFILEKDFDPRVYIPAVMLLALSLRLRRHCRSGLIAGILLAAASFYPVLSGDCCESSGYKQYPSHGGILYGGEDGILVLSDYPSPCAASRLISDINRSGIREIKQMAILDPAHPDREGLILLIAGLNIERLILSPWNDYRDGGNIDLLLVREDAVIVAGNRKLKVRPPAAPPARGVAADRNAASISISPLD
jgi:ComEC/Rec2-related protein